MKRFVVCCYSTWQNANQKLLTNVVQLAQSIQTNDKNLQQPQLVE